MKVEVNRCNYFLLNELFNEIKEELQTIDDSSKVMLYGVTSLICDYFQSTEELSNYLDKFFESVDSKRKIDQIT